MQFADNRMSEMELRNEKKSMERDKGIEPSPPPWQGGVLPLYESRDTGTARQYLIYSTAIPGGQAPARTRAQCAIEPARLRL